VINLVTIDQTKQLPIKEGEKENRDEKGGMMHTDCVIGSRIYLKAER